MRFIGVTGGVGAGKSEILGFLRQRPDTRVMLADEIAHELMKPHGSCYDRICAEFRDEDIFATDNSGVNQGVPFDSNKLAVTIFSDEGKRLRMNAIVHPAVKEYVLQEFQREEKNGILKYLVLEAALLIEEHYDTICDELWYIYTKEEIRRKRLKQSRGYSDEKIDRIFASQLPEETYRGYARVVIDNNGTKEDSIRQVEEALRRLADE